MTMPETRQSPASGGLFCITQLYWLMTVGHWPVMFYTAQWTRNQNV